MASIASLVASFVLRPTVVGALYVVALAARAGTHVQADPALGDQEREITDFVHGAYGSEIARVTLAIVAAAIVIGAALGFVAGLLVHVRDRVGRVAPRTPLGRAFATLVVTALLHGTFELWAMAKSPQLYAESFYARGGALRTLEILATDVLGPMGVLIVATLCVIAFALGPARQWSDLPRRGLGALRSITSRRRELAPLGVALGGLALFALVFRQPTSVAHADAVTAGASASQPNVIILAADSLRADRIRPSIAPTLSALADKSVRFDRAYVSLPRTFPSWVSILTGRHPHHHGIRSMFPRWEERAKDFDALPSRFARAGYATAVVSDYAGDIFGRVDLGFATVDVPYFDFRQIVRQRALERQTPLLPLLHSRLGRAFFPVLRELSDAADPHMLNGDVRAAIRRLRGKPFFLTAFYSTAHFPYAAPAPYYARFTDPRYRGRFKYHKPVGLGKEAPPDADDIRQIRALYDGSVAAIDDAVREILVTLEREKIEGRTIVIVTADHGETLFDFDHGQGHGDHLFGDEGTHVPLIVFDPREKFAPRRVSEIARDVDIAPTLYELTGVLPPSDLDGRSLVPALRGKRLAPALAYAETGLWFTEEIPALPSALRLPYPSIARLTEIDAQHGADEVVLQKSFVPLTRVAKHRMIRDERYKLVYVPARTGVQYLLYDTESDPAERHDVAAAHADIVARLEGELWTWMLKDVQMAERGGFLLPRDVAALAEGAAAGIRLGDVKAAGAPKGAAAP
jgi:arylsulfatase A-like enzyme